MKDLKEFKVPKERIHGQRLGQLIYNAIRHDKVMKENDMPGILWEIENDELQKIIDKCIKET